MVAYNLNENNHPCILHNRQLNVLNDHRRRSFLGNVISENDGNRKKCGDNSEVVKPLADQVYLVDRVCNKIK